MNIYRKQRQCSSIHTLSVEHNKRKEPCLDHEYTYLSGGRGIQSSGDLFLLGPKQTVFQDRILTYKLQKYIIVSNFTKETLK